MEQQQGSQKIAAWETEFEGVCITHTKVTTKGSDESYEDFCARHLQELRLDLIQFPPKAGTMREETR